MEPRKSPFTPDQEQEALSLFQQGLNSSDVMRHFGAKSMQKKPSWKSEQESMIKQRNKTAVLSDIPNDIGTGLRQLGEGYQERFGRLRESADALTRGEQSIGETGVQFGANIAGGLLADTTYQLARTGASLGMSQQQEDQFAESFGSAVTKVDESAGISNWYNTLNPRAQRNVNAALDILDVAPVPVLDKVRGLFGGKPKPQVDSQVALQDAYNRAARGDSASDAARVVNNSVDDAAREKLVTDLSAAYNDSLVGDLKTYNRKLQEQAQGMSRGGDIVTQDDLVRALANEGIVPDIRGKLADFTAEIRRIEERQNKLFEQYQPILDASPATANVNDFRTFAKQSLVGRRSMAAELDQAEARLDTAIDNIARSLGVDETGMLTAKQIDEMSRIANDRTGAYRDTDVFQADVFSELGRASRLWLEENVPDNAFREVNDEWMRLNNVKETAANLQNAQIDVGLLGRAIGSYVTTVGATALAAPTGNPAIALIAGMLTKMGGDEVANWMRSRKFSPEVRDVLQKNVLEKDAALLERLKQSATDQTNKNFYDALSRQLPPSRPGAPRSEVSSGAPIQTGGQTPTGRVEPGVTERTKEGVIQQPQGERTPTEIEGVLREDIDAVEQAVMEMEAEMSGAARPSVGENFVQTADGGAYRFDELPSWIPTQFRNADLMNRVMNNIVNNKKPRPNAGLEIELQKLVEDRMKTRVEEIKKGKGDRGVFSGDTAFAAALMVGGTYFLASEEGELLPIVAIGSMMANPLARKSAIQNAKMLAKNGKKLPEPYKRKIAEELEQYDTGMMTVKKDGVKTTIAPDEVDIRIEELQAKNYSGKFSNADAIEAEELMASKGVLIDSEGKTKSATTKTTDLVEEAKKYDSVEEFVRAQGTPVFHATDSDIFDPADFDVTKAAKGEQYFNPLGQGMYVSSNKDFVKRFGKNQMEFVLSADADIKTITQDEWLGGYGRDLVDEAFKEMGGRPSSISDTELNRVVRNAPIDALNQVDSLISQKEGMDVADKFVEALNKIQTKRNSQFDAIKYEATDYAFEADEIVIPDPSKLKTRTQLEDIWKQANE